MNTLPNNMRKSQVAEVSLRWQVPKQQEQK